MSNKIVDKADVLIDQLVSTLRRFEHNGTYYAAEIEFLEELQEKIRQDELYLELEARLVKLASLIK